MNFPWLNKTDEDSRDPEGVKRSDVDMHSCGDEDERYRCACSDCSVACPELEPVRDGGKGRLAVSRCTLFGGRVLCFSLAVWVVYVILLSFLLMGLWGYRLVRGRVVKANESLSLLYDDGEIDSEDEYEDDFYQRPAFLRRHSIGTRRTSDGLEEDDDYDDDDDDANDNRRVANVIYNPRHHHSTAPYKLNTVLQDGFSRLGLICASFPAVVISFSLLVVVILSFGLIRFQLEIDPVKLWVSPTSLEYSEKQHFDSNFGPFYRAQQMYLVNDTGPVLSDYGTLQWWFSVEERIGRLRSSHYGVSYNDLCLKPLGDACVIQSVTQYFGGDINAVPENWQDKLQSCADSPVSCLPPFQQPLKKEMVFGGYIGDDVITSKALVISLVVENSDDPEKLAVAQEWEELLEMFLFSVQKEAAYRGLRLSFNVEISLEKELNKSSNTDVRIVVLSYVFMFLYASLALGSVTPQLSRRYLVKSKFSLGLFGIFVVLLSVISSVGLFSYFGIKCTLIIAEVIPFLILAVGVDNIFLLTHGLETVNLTHPNLSIEERLALALGHVGPSILLSTLCEVSAFALGASVAMPAVRNFAIYSAGAVFFNSLLQMTMFMSALSLDQRRSEDDRADCFPCIRIPRISGISRPSFSSFTARVLSSPSIFDGQPGPLPSGNHGGTNVFSDIIRKKYAPYILSPQVKPIVIAIFTGWLAISLSLLPHIELGLDQRLAVPSDSYLVDYFNDLYDYFGSGPPVYFVTHDFKVTDRSSQQALCGRFSTCKEFSLMNILEQERKRPAVSYINDPAASWIDDFLQWLNPDLDDCCRFKKGTNETEVCAPHASPRTCEVCYLDKKWDITMGGLPNGDEEFLKYFNIWIEAPSDPCPLGGKAPYSHSVVVDDDSSSISTSNFRTAHTPLRSQSDFINAYASARRIAQSIEDHTGVPTYPYSTFYIFFAQYSTIIYDTFRLLSVALFITFILSTILLGSIRTAFSVCIVVACIVTNIGGIMALWDISLNAVSLVNLVICVGIGIEFCIHVARAYTFTPRMDIAGYTAVSKEMRAFNALTGVGGSVFGGIALTKLIGVCVLAFTRSKIFEVYYFRMWTALVLVASTHSLVFLPVVLTYIGGRGYLIDGGDEGVPGDLASRLYGSEENYGTEPEEDFLD
ncbi:Ncr1p [Sugiyamaella lignohabitans]|uniref:Ncr1p n=1 Tax=Sugiyamaella lignohabitans TaxID=796027 RepID=A0A167EDJ4_9ASCO|nr:Ncr1p [Sugiyamaella lignohabitans]ANB13936.1 Ncr1p [Sugiyamaella lignohabitans]